METTTKIKNNVAIIEDEYSIKAIISYTTRVAEVKRGVIYPNGKYSQSTTRHIKFVAEKFGLEIDNSKIEKVDFYKYDAGIKIKY